jgi:hypothetical protein
MEEKLNDGLNLITQSSLLKEAIKFLQKGFSWSDEKSTKIFKRLSSKEQKTPYGAIYKENGKIVIAILLFYQGRSLLEGKDVINLSSWFALQSHRGIEAITFAKDLVKALDDKIITDYTPSVAACKIFKSLNFINMEVDRHEVGACNKFPFFSILPLFKKTYLKTSKILPLKDVPNLDYQNTDNTSFFSVNTQKKLKLKLNVLNIYLTNNKKINLLKLLKLVIKHRVIKINFFSKNYITRNNNIWLIKNHKLENFILPFNSELSL